MKVSDLIEKYIVTFNDEVDGEEVGDTSLQTQDYTDVDIDKLAAEVSAVDPHNPLIFKKVSNGNIVGLFYNKHDSDADGELSGLTAIMYKE